MAEGLSCRRRVANLRTLTDMRDCSVVGQSQELLERGQECPATLGPRTNVLIALSSGRDHLSMHGTGPEEVQASG
jgi:hypothetical protein